jgi:glyoxylase-like metal-dependent hydrolase (beta-lactamase superfamily II)
MNQLVFGDVTVDRVEEMHGPIMPPSVFFPSVPPETFASERDLLVPDHMDADAEWITVAIQTWVLRSGGKTILIDTGVGNDKPRPSVEVWDQNSHDDLGALAAAGVTPDDVDIVVNTHLHVDHVGWNTRWVNEQWVPTFKNATYLMPEADVAFWNPDTNDHVAGSVNENVFEDSVRPVLEAGQVRTWSDHFRIDDALELQGVPGHTPGSSVVLLQSRDARALFAGDLVHNPIQVPHPEHNSCFCVDPEMAVRSRRTMLDWASDNRATVLPAHFSGHGAFEAARDGDRYAIRSWAKLENL